MSGVSIIKCTQLGYNSETNLLLLNLNHWSYSKSFISAQGTGVINTCDM